MTHRIIAWRLGLIVLVFVVGSGLFILAKGALQIS